MGMLRLPSFGAQPRRAVTADTPGGALNQGLPDLAMCPACARELRDPSGRRYRYPFISCNDCGPRYSVIEDLPYGRDRTSMRAFPLCPACEAEYRTPGSRRFRAESICCPACGPRLWLELPLSGDVQARDGEAIERAIGLLAAGGLLAVPGLGGLHLACDATREGPVVTLRQRSHREAKPVAVMVRDLAAARALADLSDAEAALLARPERPIVVVTARPGAALARAVAPGLDTVGLMLPATPLDQLVLDGWDRPLVMTGGHPSEEPAIAAIEDARVRLGSIADALLLHDRGILARAADSVFRLAGTRPLVLRRSRGYAPLPLALPITTPIPLLAVGADRRNTFALAVGSGAYLSPHLGDLDGPAAVERFRAALAGYRRLFDVEPQVVVHDRHPGQRSTALARTLGLTVAPPVQHQHAHVAAVLAEHGRSGPAIGVAFDGTGYGDDGAVWGGEVLMADLCSFRRLAHLRYSPLPGGDLAVRRPWRVALGYATLDRAVRPAFALAFAHADPREITLAERQIEVGMNTPMASSMGRLFDAAASVLGVRQVAKYEGQAAMELEALAGRRVAAEYAWRLDDEGDDCWILDPLPLLSRLGHLRQKGRDVADLAADFHASIAWMTVRVVRRAVEQTGVTTVVLAGGVFQNARLASSVTTQLEQHHLEVLLPRLLSPNDGAVSYGQAAVAAARLAG
jgi:hydrogenase maturation protein HypF